MSVSIWLIQCLLMYVALVECKNPGLRARITNKGLDYANTEAIKALKANVEKISIPDQSGDSDDVKYSVHNIRVSNFSPPKSTLSLEQGTGLKWTATGAAIALAGDFSYKALFIKGGGSFTAAVTDVSFSLAIRIDASPSGRPTIKTEPAQCSSNIGNVNFEFHGGEAWFLNIFSKKVGSILKDQLNAQMCQLIVHEINTDGDSKLADIPVTVTLADKFMLDYRLTQSPAFTSTYMDTFHKGEVYWSADSKSEAPMTPPTIAETSDVNNMLYLWISDYVFNTMMYQGQKHNFLEYNLTANDLPAGSRDVLNTTCSGFIPKCVGGLIPQIAQKYPNSRVEMNINSTVMPRLTVTPGGGEVTGAGTINLYARVPGRTDTPFLVTLSAKLSATVDVSLSNELLHAKVKDFNINLKAGKSAVGPIHDEFLGFLIKEALNVYFIPKLNDIGQKGFPLPVTKEIKFVNSKVTFLQDTIMIATDLSYTPSIQQVDDVQVDHKLGPLKFVPNKQLNNNIPY